MVRVKALDRWEDSAIGKTLPSLHSRMAFVGLVTFDTLVGTPGTNIDH